MGAIFAMESTTHIVFKKVWKHFLMRSGARLRNTVNSKPFFGGICFRKLLQSLWTPPMSVVMHNKNNDSTWPCSTLHNFMVIKHFLLHKWNIPAFLRLLGHSTCVAVTEKFRCVCNMMFVCRDSAFWGEGRKQSTFQTTESDNHAGKAILNQPKLVCQSSLVSHLGSKWAGFRQVLILNQLKPAKQFRLDPDWKLQWMRVLMCYKNTYTYVHTIIPSLIYINKFLCFKTYLLL